MPVTRVAVLFDDRARPETTGIYCLNALREFVDVHHFKDSHASDLSPSEFDLYLRIDDGLESLMPPTLKPSAWWAIDTHLDFERCLRQARTCELVFAAQRDGAEALRHAGIANGPWRPLACDPAIHRPHRFPKVNDVCFVGNLFPGPRAELLQQIRQRYPK